MDKLEQYLDQVCRGIAEPRSMRQHIRQELREHLKDAIAEHVASGMNEAEAVDRALEDFGGPSEVRAELLTAHGQRTLAAILDKAMAWKEKTMKAKWLWVTWAHLSLLLVLAGEVAFLSMTITFVVPKFEQMLGDGLISADRDPTGITTWASHTICKVYFLVDKGVAILLVTLALWGLFEWRVRGENKSMIRLSILGTLAAALLVPVGLAAAALVLPFMLHVPAMRYITPAAYKQEQIEQADRQLAKMEEAVARQDWHDVRHYAFDASNAVRRLGHSQLAGPLDDATRARITAAADALREAAEKSEAGDRAAFEQAVRRSHGTYDALRTAATRPS